MRTGKRWHKAAVLAHPAGSPSSAPSTAGEFSQISRRGFYSMTPPIKQETTATATKPKRSQDPKRGEEDEQMAIYARQIDPERGIKLPR